MERLAKLLTCFAPGQYHEVDEFKGTKAQQEQERVDDLNDLSTTKLAISLSENDKKLILRRVLNKYTRHTWQVEFQHEGGKQIADLTELTTEERNPGVDSLIMQRWEITGKKVGSVTLLLKKLDSKQHVIQTIQTKIPVVE